MVNGKALARPSAILKLFQVGIAVACIALIRHYHLRFGYEIGSLASLEDRHLLGVVSVGGMILVSFPLFIGLLCDALEKTTMELIYGILGTVLFLTSGALAIDYYKRDIFNFANFQRFYDDPITRAGIALGSLCIINAGLYLIDALLAIKNRK